MSYDLVPSLGASRDEGEEEERGLEDRSREEQGAVMERLITTMASQLTSIAAQQTALGSQLMSLNNQQKAFGSQLVTVTGQQAEMLDTQKEVMGRLSDLEKTPSECSGRPTGSEYPVIRQDNANISSAAPTPFSHLSSNPDTEEDSDWAMEASAFPRSLRRSVRLQDKTKRTKLGLSFPRFPPNTNRASCESSVLGLSRGGPESAQVDVPRRTPHSRNGLAPICGDSDRKTSAYDRDNDHRGTRFMAEVPYHDRRVPGGLAAGLVHAICLPRTAVTDVATDNRPSRAFDFDQDDGVREGLTSGVGHKNPNPYLKASVLCALCIVSCTGTFDNCVSYACSAWH